MADVTEDDFREEALEIRDRIAEEHHRGGHVTGFVAGCSICDELKARGQHPPVGPIAVSDDPLVEIAAARLAADELAASNPHLRVLREVREEGAADEFDLISDALRHGERALEEAAAGRHSMATVTATVGVIHAVAGLDETLRSILALLVDQNYEPEPERIDSMERTMPAPVSNDARAMYAESLARAGLPVNPTPENLEALAERDPDDAA
jgi:hypothetical protein